MTPTKIYLKGFIGIQSGLGRNEVEIDLASVSADAQLVAIKGDNGTGKTTLLDNLSPFRFLPSRASSYSPSAFSFYDHTDGNAEKVLHWKHADETYRTTFIIKASASGKTKKMECYLHHLAGDAWKAVTLPDGTSSDGKTDTYDACVEHIVGSPSLFFTSAFAAQSRPALSSYTNGDIKGLMSEVLGMENVAQMGKQASDVAKGLQAPYAGFQQQLARIGEREGALRDTEWQLDSKQGTVPLQDQARQQARNNLRTMERLLAEAKVDAGASASLEIERQRLQAQLTASRQHQNERAAEIRTDIQHEQTGLNELGAKNDAAIHTYRAKHNMLTARIERLQATLNRREAIEEARAAVPISEQSLEEAQAVLSAARQDMEQYRQLQTDIGAVRSQIQGAKTQGENIAAYVDRLLAQAHLADRVPCTGTDLQPQCELLADAVKAKDEAPAKQTELQTAQAQYAELTAKGNELTERAEQLAGALEAHEQAETGVATAQKHLANCRELAALADTLDQATADLVAAQAELAQLDEAQAQAGAEHLQAIDARHARIIEMEERMADITARYTTEQETIQDQLSKMPPPGDNAAVQAAEAKVKYAEEALQVVEQAMDELMATIAQLKATAAAIRTELEGAGAIKAKAEALAAEIGFWRTLATALGPNGVIALSIDDAGPQLASITNDLLMACYGPRFTVSIQTQTETAAGDAKETFDIVVFDGETDQSKSVRKMSGGERVWINECLTRAIALYQAQQSGQHYGCLFADESDGALDPKRKQMFMDMKRRVLELGGYEHEFFITHTPELQDMADAVIDMNALRAVA